ncbi:hypothetical protein BV25DRAFT_1825368 [Artomyces pyxidatus]|uniref:Uncharacterized protein n=1 Tax=Artomyces pyxidatus TaxID=48021 RepID=A0ACB8T1V3_9AGAM|nr:hypothetical protein BV25DRAFT_1825368 [Artomyces pyxidatus]
MTAREPKFAFDVVLPPRADKVQDVRDFLTGSQPLIVDEPDTLHWYGYKTLDQPDGTPGFFGIFDTFPSEAGRNAHSNGKVAAALFAHADTLLSGAPQLAPVDILGHSSAAAGTPKIGVRAIFTAKAEAAEQVKAYMTEGEALVREEPKTLFWFAFQKDATTFGVVALFETEEDRAAHASGAAATAFDAKAASLLDGSVEAALFDVIAVKTPA